MSNQSLKKQSPNASNSSTIQILHIDGRVESFFTQENSTLHCCWNSGFFSNCSVTLWGLIDLFNRGIIPESISFSKSFQDYRTDEQIQQQTDLYPFYFKTDSTQAIKLNKKVLKPNHHDAYRILDFGSYNLFLQKYFNLSDSLLEYYNFLIQKYRIIPEKTIAVIYRGTDKYKEVKLAEPELYLKKAEAVLKQNPDFRVLIQTDQEQVRDLFVNRFRDKCFFIEEMPVTKSQEVLHKADPNFLGMNKFEFGQVLLAVTYLLSKCEFIVNHTGNMAFWICLFRGNSNRVFQFDNEGALMPNSYFGVQTTRFRKKLIRRISQWWK